jgi:hypothetical protein
LEKASCSAPALGQRLGLAADAGADHEALHLAIAAQVRGEMRQLVGGVADLALLDLGDDEDAAHRVSPCAQGRRSGARGAEAG